MIERYSRPEMAAHLDRTGQARPLAARSRSPSSTRGRTPAACRAADAEKVRAARYNIDDIARYQAETHHDVTAFLQVRRRQPRRRRGAGCTSG